MIAPSTLLPVTVGFLLHSTTRGATTLKVNSFLVLPDWLAAIGDGDNEVEGINFGGRAG